MNQSLTDAADFDSNPLPPFPRHWPTTDTPREAVILLANIDNRIAWLAERGLSPHPNVLERRAEVAAIVETNAMLERVTQAELQEPTRCHTPLLGSIESETIRQIAALSRQPLDLPRKLTMEVRQPDGSVKVVPLHATWHNPRHRPTPPPEPGLVRRFVRWLGLSR